MLFWLLAGIALLLASVYLFLMNHLAMQGYVLRRETEKSLDIAILLEQLDSQVTRHETHKFLTETLYVKQMTSRERRKFVVMRLQTLTAQNR